MSDHRGIVEISSLPGFDVSRVGAIRQNSVMSSLHVFPGRIELPLLVDYRSDEGARVEAVRSILTSASLETLRELGHFDRYFELLPHPNRHDVLGAVEHEWLPVGVADVHYATCDALRLDEAQLRHIGARACTKLLETFRVAPFHPSRESEAVTPWLPLAHYGRVFRGLLRGGTCTVEGIGPRDAVVRANGATFFATRYFRSAYHSVLRGAVAMFAQEVVGRTTGPEETGPLAVVTTLSWR